MQVSILIQYISNNSYIPLLLIIALSHMNFMSTGTGLEKLTKPGKFAEFLLPLL